VKVRKVREGPAIQQVGFHILEWSLYLALGLRAMRAAGPWLPIAYALCRPRIEGPNRMDRQFRCPAFCTPILMHASPPLILGKSRMRKRACTDLCGGRSAMVVPTATLATATAPRAQAAQASCGRRSHQGTGSIRRQVLPCCKSPSHVLQNSLSRRRAEVRLNTICAPRCV
jgi:hypothetical protein